MKYLLILLTLFSFNAFAEPVNINKADAKTLSKSLKGIGMKKAQAIVRYRKKNGAFKTLDDLMNVKGIGEKTIKKNASDIGLSKGKTETAKKAKKTKKKVTKQDKKKSKSKAKSKTKDKKEGKKSKKKTKAKKKKSK
jgi:competence protein ComEA